MLAIRLTKRKTCCSRTSVLANRCRRARRTPQVAPPRVFRTIWRHPVRALFLPYQLVGAAEEVCVTVEWDRVCGVVSVTKGVL